MSPKDKIKKIEEYPKWKNSKEIAEYFSQFDGGFNKEHFKINLEKAIDSLVQWNSPEEKPKSKYLISKKVLIYYNETYAIGFYNFESNHWWAYPYGRVSEDEIDGWQYLPEPIDK